MHAISYDIPDNILKSLISYIGRVKGVPMSAVEVFQSWSESEGFVFPESPDFVLHLIDYISQCIEGGYDTDSLVKISEEEFAHIPKTSQSHYGQPEQ